MAQKVFVSRVDDLDGTSDETVRPVEFSLDGVAYEIDLSDANAERLRDAFAEVIPAARRTGGRKRIGPPGRVSVGASTSQPGEAGLIREWALENGFELSASGRGRLPADVVDAYKKANKDQVRTRR